MTKTWKVKALIPFPLKQTAPPDPQAGGLPKNLKWESRIAEIEKKSGDVVVRLKKIDYFTEWRRDHYGKITEPAEVQLTIVAEDAHAALESVDQLLEDICDDLSFRLQMPVPIYKLEVIDVTEPVAIGENREALLYPFPVGYGHPKFKQVQFLNPVHIEIKP